MKMPFEGDRRRAALELLRGLIGPIRSSPGCVDCCLYECAEKEGRILFSVAWRNREEMERHIRSGTFRRILSVVELASEAPEVCFETISETRGMEYVVAIRGNGRVG